MLGARTLALLTVAYLGSLFALAALVDRGIGRRLSRHPAVTAMSLGVYSTSWTFFASVGFTATEGWRGISTSFGASLSCALVPVVWAPLARVVKARQLASLADLFAYRYQSRSAAGLVTALLLVSSLPYQAQQLHAIVEMVAQLGGAGARGAIAAATTGVLVLFGVMYGVRHLTPRERHDGLVAAVAFESVVKLVAHGALGGFALFVVFGGARGLDTWLAAHPEAITALTMPARDSSWASLLLIAMAAAFLLPRQWHMAFTEGDERGLRAASFGLPAYLLLIHVTVPLVLWAGQALTLSERPDFYALGMVRASGSRLFGGVVFLGGLSAATAMIVVTTVALAGMVQNHLVLPLTGVAAGPGELYPRLRWVRRGLVGGIILLGYGVYLVTRQQPRLVDLGLVSFVAVAQLVPGLAGVLVWPRATARGLMAGLAAGIACWIATPVIPILAGRNTLPLDTGTDLWTFSTVLSFSTNALAFVWGSLRRDATAAERDAAEFCRRQIDPPTAGLVGITSAAGFIARLAPVLGTTAAETEVARALADLGLDIGEARPERLQALRERLERNLSGLLGPMTARMIVDEQLAVDAGWRSLLSARLRYVDDQLAAERLEGPARALEDARRFLRGVLEDQPIGVAALGPAGDVALWNDALARVSGLAGADVSGRRLGELPPPWGPVLASFVGGVAAEVEITVETRTVLLRRAEVEGTEPGGRVLLIEDRTEHRAREARVAHQERLASIGHIAAGVAHEVNNPAANIRMIAQRLQGKIADADVGGDLGRIVEQTERIKGIVHALKGFARGGAGGTASVAREPVALAKVVAEAVTLARMTSAGRVALFDVDVPADLVVPGDRQRLEQVILNLLANACDASSAEGRVSIAAARTGESARVTVTDTGCGMSEEVLARIFEPYFTTKRSEEGTGLGMALVHRIVVEHGGTIEVHSRLGEGTSVTLELPADMSLGGQA